MAPSELGKPQPAAPVPLDGTDRAIITALVDDGRLTNAALAARVGVAESTCAYRLRALRESGVISRIGAQVNHDALGYPLQAVIKVRLGSHDKRHVERLYADLVRAPGVLRVLHVAGEDDFHLHVAVASAHDLRDLVLEHVTMHPVVTQTQTQLIFEERVGRDLPGGTV